MVADNPTWGAPRIHGELLMLGFDLSERTVSRWMKRTPRDPDRAKRWLVFLRNHREGIAAMDFFTVPTITFGVLYCFFIISHDRRRILHPNQLRWCQIPLPDLRFIASWFSNASENGIVENLLASNPQIFGEGPLVIDPLSLPAKSGSLRDLD